MKHKLSITLLLLAMFLLTQFVGVFVVDHFSVKNVEIYNPETGITNISTIQNNLPFGLDSSEEDLRGISILSIIFMFIIGFFVFTLLMKFNVKYVIKLWFFLVIVIALAVSSSVFFSFSKEPCIYAMIFGVCCAGYKIMKPNVIIHNVTEMLIYPGIAVILIPIINVWGIIILLILISLYDAWAVWKSKIMQKMAKYQMSELNVFGGFLIPVVDAKTREEIKMIRAKYRNKTIPASIRKRKYKISLAILGGGDVVFPIITAGIFMRAFPQFALFGINGLIPALFVIGGALLGLSYLFFNTKKGKAYPAMPYITTGIFLGLLVWWGLFF